MTNNKISELINKGPFVRQQLMQETGCSYYIAKKKIKELLNQGIIKEFKFSDRNYIYAKENTLEQEINEAAANHYTKNADKIINIATQGPFTLKDISEQLSFSIEYATDICNLLEKKYKILEHVQIQLEGDQKRNLYFKPGTKKERINDYIKKSNNEINDSLNKDLTLLLIEKELEKEPLMMNEIMEKTKIEKDSLKTKINHLQKSGRIKKAGPKGTGNVQYYYIKGVDYGAYQPLTKGKCNTKHAKKILKEIKNGPVWMPSISENGSLYQSAERMVNEGVLEKIEANVSGTKTVLYAFPDQTIKELKKSVTTIEDSLDISNDKDSLRIKEELEKTPLTVADLVKIIGHNPEYIKRRLNQLISKRIAGKAGKPGKTFVQYYYIKKIDYGLFQPLTTGKCNTDYAKELLIATSKGSVWLPSLNHEKYACIRNGAERMVKQGLLKRSETIMDGNKRVYYDLAEPFKSAQIKRNLEKRIKDFTDNNKGFTIKKLSKGFPQKILSEVLNQEVELGNLIEIEWNEEKIYVKK